MSRSSAIGMARGERVPDVGASRWSAPGGPRLPRSRRGRAAPRGWDRQRRTRSSATARTCCVPRTGTPGRSTRSCVPCAAPGSRVRRSPSASTRTDGSASCSSTVRCPSLPIRTGASPTRALASIARLLRGLHDAARQFDGQGLTWDDGLADPAGGTVVCHNDVEPSNVVFRDGVAVVLVDFEFAAPGRPVYDLARCPDSACRSTMRSTRLGWAGEPPTDRPGSGSSPTRTAWTAAAEQSCSAPWTTPSIESRQPSAAVSTPGTRTPSRCGTAPVGAPVSTAVADGGPSTTKSSPPPSADAFVGRPRRARMGGDGSRSGACRRPVGSQGDG